MLCNTSRPQCISNCNTLSSWQESLPSAWMTGSRLRILLNQAAGIIQRQVILLSRTLPWAFQEHLYNTRCRCASACTQQRIIDGRISPEEQRQSHFVQFLLNNISALYIRYRETLLRW